MPGREWVLWQAYPANVDVDVVVVVVERSRG